VRFRLTPAEGQRRLAAHDHWLRTHPWWGRAISVWFALLVLVLAELLRYVFEHLARVVTS